MNYREILHKVIKGSLGNEVDTERNVSQRNISFAYNKDILS